MKRTKYKYSGKTSTRPDNLTTNDIGYEYFDIEKNVVSFWNGTEWIELSPETEEELKEVFVVDNNLQLLDCPIQICNNLADNTTILLPSLTEEYKEVKLIFSAESDLNLILSDGEDTLSITSSIGVKELLVKKVFGEWSIVLIDLR